MLQKQGILPTHGRRQSVPVEWLARSAAIAERIHGVLRAKMMLQKDLAATIGIKPQQVSKILKGNVNLTLGTISKLEAALGIRLLEVVVHDPEVAPHGGVKRERKRHQLSHRVFADIGGVSDTATGAGSPTAR